MKTYLLLTKPGIILGNAVTMASAFVLASRGGLDLMLFVKTLLALGCIIASACVWNHYLDRASDAKMERTKNRPLVTGAIGVNRAIAFALLLALIGFPLMATTNLFAFGAAAVGYVVYVALYSLLKHHTIYGTLIGSIAGAMPPVVGYLAVKNDLDSGALLLFLILVCWQMPHFYAIAFFRLSDYAAANIPVLPVERGAFQTKLHMLLYVLAFMFIALLLTPLGYTGMVYFLTVSLLGLTWLSLTLKGFFITNHTLWGRRMFTLSLFVVTFTCLTMAYDAAG